MPRLHEGQIEVPDALVRSLVDSQFPEWSGLELRRLESDGTIHRIDRLGDDLVVRLPFIDWAVEDVARDAERLPLLAAALPVAVPTLEGRGVPAPGMPWHWGVYRWLDGRHPRPGVDDATVANALAEVVLALRAIASQGPASPAAFNPIADDAATRPKVLALDSPAALEAWDAAVRLGARPGAASGWIHGDLIPGNLLLGGDGGSGDLLTAIIDWGASGIGDLAIDLLAAWTCFDSAGRATYLAALSASDMDIALARALAVRKVAWGLDYYRGTNPGFVAVLEHTLRQIESE